MIGQRARVKYWSAEKGTLQPIGNKEHNWYIV
jgi:hypothetical protein